MNDKKRIGILALQGAFAEHAGILKQLGAETFFIRKRADINKAFDGLVLPGGESTVMGRLLHDLSLYEALKQEIEKGLPVFGTCAGMLLLAKYLVNDERVHLGTMNIQVRRNAYGRQLGSYERTEAFAGIGDFPMVFIRAPYIEKISDGIEILARVDGRIVAARQKNQLVTAFHPELTEDTRVHAYFLKMV